MNKKKVIIIISVVLCSLLFVFLLLPRIIVFGVARKFMPAIEKQAMQFSDYPVSFFDGDTVRVSNGKCTAVIPAGMEEKETNGNKVYKSADGRTAVALIKPTPYDMDMISSIPESLTRKQVTDFFGALGNGVPDSGYGTEKCVALLSPGDYSFLNFEKGLAFAVTGTLKNVLYGSCDSIYIYEKGKVRGMITVTRKDETNNYRIQCDIFSTDDLNTVNTLLIGVDSPEEAYPIIASVSFE